MISGSPHNHRREAFLQAQREAEERRRILARRLALRAHFQHDSYRRRNGLFASTTKPCPGY